MNSTFYEFIKHAAPTYLQYLLLGKGYDMHMPTYYVEIIL